jgi:hypothetical protein
MNPAVKGLSPPGKFQAAKKPAYWVTMINGPGVDSARPSSINICWVESQPLDTATVERSQKLVFTYPLSKFHNFLVHDGDLTCWTTETDEAQLCPEF